MKDKILEYLESLSSKKASFDNIKQALNNPKNLGRNLDEFVSDGILFINRNKEYCLCSFYHMIPCLVIYVDSKGMKVLNKIDNTSIYYIETNLSEGAIYNDLVLIGFRRNNCYVYSILKEYDDLIVGNVKSGRFSKYIIPINENYPLIDIEGNYPDDEIVSVKIIERIPRLIGKVVESLGNQYNSLSRIKGIVRDSKINLRFDEELLKEASFLKDEDINNELEYRKDLTNELFVTIDGIDAKDLDDSICVSKKNNIYNLKVSIADVSHYVIKYSLIDKEALKRGTSIYFPGYVIPMLPEVLSNDLCSLNPNTLKLTLTCDMDINDKGEVVNYDIYESFIKSKYRLNYDEVNEYFNNKNSFDNSLNNMLDNALELSKILSTSKQNRGEISLNIEEPNIRVDEDLKVLNISKRKIDKAEKLIEDFMIIANETVASHFNYLELPFIYRNHEQPSQSKYDELTNLVHNLGYNLICNDNQIYPKSYQVLLDKIDDENIKKIISLYMLRAMSKARYSNSNLGHFGLASICYTHFTSPIRRYPDLLVHRLIKMYLHQEKYNVSNLNKEIKLIADLSSDNELKALDLERKVDDIKMAEYMLNHIGDVYSGFINSITEFGMFIELDNLVEGLVRFASMNDFYEFDEKNNKAIGKRTHKEYKIGDIVKVIVKNVNIYKGKIDFELVD